MDFSFSDQQQELRQQARSFLQTRFPPRRLAELADSEVGWDPASWAELAKLGWLGVSVPESLGGSGLTFIEEAILFEELGRALYPGPYFSTIALALPALAEEQLTDVAMGRRRWSAQLDGDHGLVVDLTSADKVVVSRGDELIAVDARGTLVNSIDPTRRLGRLSAAEGEVLLEGGEAASALRQMGLRMAAALALEAIGVGERVLELGVEHAKNREQFGKPIGTYQAVSHQLVDSYMEIELARSLAYWAAWCIAEGNAEAPIAVAAAKSAAAEAAVAACERSIQVHGGIGFTWESVLHRYYKRALWIERFGGSPAQQRETIAVALLDR